MEAAVEIHRRIGLSGAEVISHRHIPQDAGRRQVAALLAAKRRRIDNRLDGRAWLLEGEGIVDLPGQVIIEVVAADHSSDGAALRIGHHDRAGIDARRHQLPHLLA